MILRYLKRIFLWLASGFVTILGLMVLGLNLLPLATNYLNQHRQFIEEFAESIMSQPITVGEVSMVYKGILPEVLLKNVSIFNDAGNVEMAKIKEIKIDIDLLSSVRHLAFMSRAVNVNGAHLILSKTNKNISIKDVLEFIFTQHKIILHDATVDWVAENGSVFSTSFTNVTLQPGPELKQAELLAKAAEKAVTMPKALYFEITIPPNSLRFKSSTHKTKLSDWLNQAVADENKISGSLNVYDFEKLFLGAHIKNLNLSYYRDWPKLTEVEGDVLLKNESLFVNADSGKLNGVAFKNAKMEIPDLIHPELAVEGKVKAAMEDGVNYIKASPLNATLGKHFEKMTLAGPLDLDIKMKFILGGEKHPPEINGNIHLQNNALLINDWGLKAKNLMGMVHFSAHAIEANNIKGDLFAKSTYFDLKTIEPNTLKSVLEAHICGAADSKILFSKISPAISKYVFGEMTYAATIKMPNNKANVGDNLLILESSLDGVQVDLPSPLQKNAAEAKSMQVLLKFKEEKKKQFTLTYGKDLVLMQNDGALIAKFAELGWDKWYDFIRQLLNEKRSAENIAELVFDIAKFNAFGQVLEPAKLRINIAAQKKSVAIAIASPNVIGKIVYSYGINNHYINGRFNKLHLNTSKNEVSSQPAYEPKDVYAMDIASSDFKYNAMQLGELALKTLPYDEGMKVHSLRISSKFWSLSANGAWEKKAGKDIANMQGTFDTSNLGALLKEWDLGSNLLGARGKAVFNLSWQKPFYSPDLKTLNGTLNLNLTDGRIVNLGRKAEEELGIGRFLNLFSLQSLPRHLTLDFRDITSKGFLFDKIIGLWNFKDGNIFTQDTSLDGQIATIDVKGRIGLVAKDYALKLYTMPHITGSLPIIAAVVIQPIAGAAAWVFDQIVRHKAKNKSKPGYSITGTWDKPVVVKLN